MPLNLRKNVALPNLSVGIVSASLSRAAGGVLPIMQGHGRGLRERGAQVVAYGVSDAYSEEDAASWHPVAVHNLPSKSAGFAYAPGLVAALAAGQHDLLHQHGLWQYPSVAVSRWRRMTGRPVVVSVQGMLEAWALSQARMKKRVAAALYERANLQEAACIHCSRAELRGVREFGLRNPVAVIPNGVILPDPERRPPEPEWLRRDHRRTLLFLGRLNPKKGIEETLQAWAILKDRSREIAVQWRLVIAGWDDGGHEARYRHMVGDLGLGADVLFAGPLFDEAKAAALGHADAFLLASYSEGLPMAVLEAWGHGLPVFMTRACNIPEGFEAGAAVEVTTNPSDLADALARGLADPKLSELGIRGRALVSERFGWDAVGAELHAVYTWLLGRGDRPASIHLA